MGFKIKAPEFIARKVNLTIPGDPPTVGSVKVTYKWLSVSAYKVWIESSALAGGGFKGNAEWLGEVILSIDGLTDEDDKPIEYSPAVLASLCDDFPAAGVELRDGFSSALSESKAKN